MALAGWLRYCSIAVAASKLPQTVSDQVVTFYTAHFPTGMVTLGGSDACASDGSDIRFSSDAAGNTLLPFDIATISLNATPANSVLICHVKIAVTANAAFTIYCWWSNVSATRPAPNNAIGAAACWSQLYGVLYLQENPANYTTTATKWKCFKEATNIYSAGSIIGAPTQVAGPITGMKGVSITATAGIQIPEVISTGASDTFTMACWCMPATVNYSGALFFSGASEMLIGWDTSYACKWQYASAYASPQFGANKGSTWKLVVVQVSGTSANFFIDPSAAGFNVPSISTMTNLQYLGGADTGGTVKAGAFSIAYFMIGKFVATNINWFWNMQKNFDNIATLATPGTITALTSSATLTLTGLVNGSEVRIYNAGTEVAGIASVTGNQFTYSYSSAFTAQIVIVNSLYNYIQYASLALTTSGATIPIQQITDIWYTASYSSSANATNIVLATGTSPMTIQVKVPLALKDIYSYLKDQWKSDNALMKQTFPLTPITDEQFKLNYNWQWLDATSINNIDNAGWSRRDATDTSVEEYMNITTLGTVTGAAYYQQASAGATTNAIVSGPMNQPIKVYGNATNGNFDYRAYYKIWIRNLGYTYSNYDLLASQNLTTLTYRKYSIPLINSGDTNATVTNTTTLTATPYSAVTITYLTANIRGAWVAATSYAVGDVIQWTTTGTPDNRWYKCITANTSSAAFATDTAKWQAWTSANSGGERQIGTSYYAFNTIINGNALTLNQIYSTVQYRLTLASNINASGTSVIGNTASQLMSYIGTRALTSQGVFIDNFASSDINNVDIYDYTNTKRVFPTTVTFTLTGLDIGSEVLIMDTAKNTISTIASTPGTTYSYSYQYTADITISVVIVNLLDVIIRYDNLVLGSSNQSIPIQMQNDRWYNG